MEVDYHGAGIQPGSGEFAYNVGPVASGAGRGPEDAGVETVDAGGLSRASAASAGTGSRRTAEVRIAVVYDCLYPNTIGGAERWYRNLAERLAGGHRSTT